MKGRSGRIGAKEGSPAVLPPMRFFSELVPQIFQFRNSHEGKLQLAE